MFVIKDNPHDAGAIKSFYFYIDKERDVSDINKTLLRYMVGQSNEMSRNYMAFISPAMKKLFNCTPRKFSVSYFTDLLTYVLTSSPSSSQKTTGASCCEQKEVASRVTSPAVALKSKSGLDEQEKVGNKRPSPSHSHRPRVPV